MLSIFKVLYKVGMQMQERRKANGKKSRKRTGYVDTNLLGGSLHRPSSSLELLYHSLMKQLMPCENFKTPFVVNDNFLDLFIRSRKHMSIEYTKLVYLP